MSPRGNDAYRKGTGRLRTGAALLYGRRLGRSRNQRDLLRRGVVPRDMPAHPAVVRRHRRPRPACCCQPCFMSDAHAGHVCLRCRRHRTRTHGHGHGHAHTTTPYCAHGRRVAGEGSRHTRAPEQAGHQQARYERSTGLHGARDWPAVSAPDTCLGGRISSDFWTAGRNAGLRDGLTRGSDAASGAGTGVLK